MATTANLPQTLGIAAALLAAGQWLTDRVPTLARLNIPPAVTAGLGFCFLLTVLRSATGFELTVDTSVQPVWMGLLFSSIGLSASARTLRRGGTATLALLLLSTLFCALQNALGIAVARGLGLHPLLGVMAGSVTLVGGPATGLAFAPLFEKAGLASADLIAMTSATFGIVSGALLGGPVAAALIRRRRRHLGSMDAPHSRAAPVEVGTGAENSEWADPSRGRSETTYLLLLTVIGLGTLISTWLEKSGITLPGYIGGMILAVLARNWDDRAPAGRAWIDLESAEKAGEFALSFFLVTALMNLKLWNLASLALPLAALLALQALAVIAFSVLVIDRLMGGDYESAVMSSGFVGFALGTTANALSNMRAVANRHGPAPHAFLVVPLVGAFFIDFVNALMITALLNYPGGW